jgi:hypothetical protein
MRAGPQSPEPDSLVDRIRFVVPRLVEAGIPAEVIDLDTRLIRRHLTRVGPGRR